MNKPYVKEYDGMGKLTNAIDVVYLNDFPNRKERRLHLNQTRFKGNKKGISLTVLKTGRYVRKTQVLNYNDHNDPMMVTVGKLTMPVPRRKSKQIEHYVLR